MNKDRLTLGIMQPYIFPYIGYFQYIAATEVFVLYNDVAFIKQGWVNRNQILVEGKAHLFSIPVRAISSFKKIKDTELQDEQYAKWRKKFLITLKHQYKNAPCFSTTYPLIENILNASHQTINDLATKSILDICKCLGIGNNLLLSPDQFDNSHLEGEERIINICEKVNAGIYINPIGGINLYGKKNFAEKGIVLKFIKSKLPAYQQFNQDFVPSLSIIDVLMFNSIEQISNMLNEYEFL